MTERKHLQPWIEEREAECMGVTGLEPGYLDGMIASLLDRDMGSLARFAFAYARAAGVSTLRIVATCREVTFTKGEGYAGSSDFLANFYRVGRREGIHAIQALAVYVWKHLDWIDTYTRTGIAHGSEGLESRLGDIVLYAALGQAIQVREGQGGGA